MKISFARNIALATIVSATLTGCFDDAQPTGPAHDVDWFLANQDERNEVLKQCRNNPGKLAETSNCINAGKAAERDTSGSLRNLEGIKPLSFGKDRSEGDD